MRQRHNWQPQDTHVRAADPALGANEPCKRLNQPRDAPETFCQPKQNEPILVALPEQTVVRAPSLSSIRRVDSQCSRSSSSLPYNRKGRAYL